MAFLDLCDDTLGHALDLMRPFEAICLGLTCRRLHGMVQERRAAIAAKLRATGYRGVCYCVDPRTATPMGPWLWGHLGCAHDTSFIQPAMCGLAAGGHTNLFWRITTALIVNRDRLSLTGMYHVFNAAIGAGEREIANIILPHMEIKMHCSQRLPEMSADNGFISAATNGHYETLRSAYLIDDWMTRVWHRGDAMALAAICAGAPVKHVTAYVTSSNYRTDIVQYALEYKRVDILEALVERHPYIQIIVVNNVNVHKVGQKVLRKALDIGLCFDLAVFRDVLECGYIPEALIMGKQYGWPEHALAIAARRATPEDLRQLMAAGCPSSPEAIEAAIGVAMAGGDPEVLRLVAAAPGAHWSKELQEKIRGLGDAAVALARSAGAPP